MAIEGTGIKAPSKKASRMAMVTGGPRTPVRIDDVTTGDGKTFKRVLPDAGAGRVGEIRLKKAEAPTETFERRDFFSMKTDPRNEVKVALGESGFTRGSDTSFLDSDDDYKTFTDQYGGYYDSFPGSIKKNIKLDYLDKNPTKYEQFLNKAPVKDKPSILDRVTNLAGSIFNTVTLTQPAAASQIPGGMPSGTQFTSSNLDAAKTPTGDTSFSSYRMGGGEQQQQSETVVTPTVKPQYQINREQNRPSVGGGGEGQQKGIVSPTSTVTPRQTVASLPSNYKQTEAEAFRKTAAFKEAQGIAKRNPNVSVGVDSKGQPVARAVQKTRDEAGSSARTAQGNQARVKSNSVARAQAAAVNRKISGKSISQTKAANKASMRKAAAERNASFQARKKAGKLSSSERTAKGQRAAKKAAARKRAQAAAKKRRAKKKSKSK